MVPAKISMSSIKAVVAANLSSRMMRIDATRIKMVTTVTVGTVTGWGSVIRKDHWIDRAVRKGRALADLRPI